MGNKPKEAEYAKALGEKYAYFAPYLDPSKWKISDHQSKRELDIPYMEWYDRLFEKLSTVQKEFVVFSTNLPDEKKGKRTVKGGLDCIAQVYGLTCLFADDERQSALALLNISREVLNSNNTGDMLEHLEKLKLVVERNIIQKKQNLAKTHRVLLITMNTPLCKGFLPSAFRDIEIPTIDDFKMYILEPSMQHFMFFATRVAGLAIKIGGCCDDQPGRQESEEQSGDELMCDITCEAACEPVGEICEPVGEPVSYADEPLPDTLYQLVGDPFEYGRPFV